MNYDLFLSHVVCYRSKVSVDGDRVLVCDKNDNEGVTCPGGKRIPMILLIVVIQ